MKTPKWWRSIKNECHKITQVMHVQKEGNKIFNILANDAIDRNEDMIIRTWKWSPEKKSKEPYVWRKLVYTTSKKDGIGNPHHITFLWFGTNQISTQLLFNKWPMWELHLELWDRRLFEQHIGFGTRVNPPLSDILEFFKNSMIVFWGSLKWSLVDNTISL